MSEELKPCPFCGGAARIESNRDWHRLYAAHDDDCIFDADDHDIMYPAQPGYLKEIVENWNRRTPVAARELDVEAERDQFSQWHLEEFGYKPSDGEAYGHLFDVWLAARSAAQSTAPVSTEQAGDAQRFAWLAENPTWGKRGRLKKEVWEWQMMRDGDPWGQWGDYRKMVDAARKAYPSPNNSPVGEKD